MNDAGQTYSHYTCPQPSITTGNWRSTCCNPVTTQITNNSQLCGELTPTVFSQWRRTKVSAYTVAATVGENTHLRLK